MQITPRARNNKLIFVVTPVAKPVIYNRNFNSFIHIRVSTQLSSIISVSRNSRLLLDIKSLLSIRLNFYPVYFFCVNISERLRIQGWHNVITGKIYAALYILALDIVNCRNIQSCKIYLHSFCKLLNEDEMRKQNVLNFFTSLPFQLSKFTSYFLKIQCNRNEISDSLIDIICQLQDYKP